MGEKPGKAREGKWSWSEKLLGKGEKPEESMTTQLSSQLLGKTLAWDENSLENKADREESMPGMILWIKSASSSNLSLPFSYRKEKVVICACPASIWSFAKKCFIFFLNFELVIDHFTERKMLYKIWDLWNKITINTHAGPAVTALASSSQCHPHSSFFPPTQPRVRPVNECQICEFRRFEHYKVWQETKSKKLPQEGKLLWGTFY